MFEPVAEPPGVPPGDRSIRESGARRLARVLRERWLIVVSAFAAGVAAALLYVSFVTPVYQADAQLLISPVTDPNLDALGLIRSSSDPSTDTQTAALLVGTPQVAAEAARLLRISEAPQAVLARVQATPVAGSDVLAVTANASTPAAAASLANAFAQAAIVVRTRVLQAQLRTAIPRLQAQINRSPQQQTATATNSLVGELAALQALLGAPDPTIQLGSPATSPTSPSSPRRTLSLAAGGILGLIIGIAVALAADVLDTRLRRESQLQGVLDLPILARLPWLPNGVKRQPSVHADQLVLVRTAHEFLADSLDGLTRPGDQQKRTIVFTAVNWDAGCTTIALNHAWLMAAGGQRVILVDGDPRTPAVARATGARPSRSVARVLAGSQPIQKALVSVAARNVKLRVLAVDERLDHSFPVRMPAGPEMIAELLQDADVLVVDAPPLAQSARALFTARSADCVVVVARIGVTKLAEVRELGELLAGHGVQGGGILVIGAPLGRGRRWRRRAWREALAAGALRFRTGRGKDGRLVPREPEASTVHSGPRDVAGRPQRLPYGARDVRRQ